jgi:(1->4)-alpha-D-glucan 1-alpha-D-glucosylmutase
VRRAVEVLLARPEPNPFLSDLRRFVAEIAPFGACNSLALVALKLTSPGVPDVYQGHEDGAFALVDPDNRRPVDFAVLAKRLDGVRTLAGDAHSAAALRELPLPDGPHKLFVTWRLLQWRRQAAALFRDGTYEPLDCDGPGADHVVAFARRHDGRCSVTVVPRLVWTLSGGALDTLLDGSAWGETRLRLPASTAGGWHDVLAGRPLRVVPDGGGAPTLRLRDLLAGLPVAVLADRP